MYTYIIPEHLGPHLLGLLFVDVFHKNSLVFEYVSLGLKV